MRIETDRCLLCVIYETLAFYGWLFRFSVPHVHREEGLLIVRW